MRNSKYRVRLHSTGWQVVEQNAQGQYKRLVARCSSRHAAFDYIEECETYENEKDTRVLQGIGWI